MAGYWLNPEIGKYVEVPTTHDDFLRNRQNALAIGISDAAYSAIMHFPATAIDEIRLVGVMNGLIRIREHRRYTSLQFFIPSEHLEKILQAAADSLTKLGTHPDTYLHIDNLLTHDSAGLTLTNLQEKLAQRESIW
jgi:hypothetical protein